MVPTNCPAAVDNRERCNFSRASSTRCIDEQLSSPSLVRRNRFFPGLNSERDIPRHRWRACQPFDSRLIAQPAAFFLFPFFFFFQNGRVRIDNVNASNLYARWTEREEKEWRKTRRRQYACICAGGRNVETERNEVGHNR